MFLAFLKQIVQAGGGVACSPYNHFLSQIPNLVFVKS